MRRRTFAAGLALTHTLMLSHALPARAQGMQPGSAATPIRVGGGLGDNYAEPYYALDGGFFARANLDATVTAQGPQTQNLDGIIAGALDVGVTNTVGFATAVLHGIPLAIIAAAGLYLSEAAATVLAVARDSPLRVAKDLEGKIVGVSGLQDMNAVGAKAWLTAGGADITQVRFVELGFNEMGPALARGTVAAATMAEPFITADASEVRVFAKMFDAIGHRFANGIWIATPAFVNANRRLVHRFVEAIYATAKWANGHHDETAAILARRSKVDLATTLRMTRVVYAESLDPKLVQPSIDFAWKFKLLPSRVDVASYIARA